ncbi:MAG: CinA family protein [Bacteroidetes bacterium]|nr:CinA family protein [Bacteroidota bacterium]
MIEKNQEFILNIYKSLKSNKSTISLAESCTGGYISYLLTTIPGISEFYKGSIIAYDKSIKINLLKISETLIECHGVVSREVALTMAQNIRLLMNTNIGFGITGIAGPDGGSKYVDVGVIWIAANNNNRTLSKKLNLKGNRENR